MESKLLSRSSRASDPLSDVLALVRPQGFMSGGVNAGGNWSFRFDPVHLFQCFAVMSGQCWLAIDGVGAPIQLKAGDFVALPAKKSFCLTSDLKLEPINILSVVTEPLLGRILEWQGGGDCLAISALFTFEDTPARSLLDVLPPVIHIQKESDRAAIRSYLERMMTILRDPQPGHVLLGEHLAQVILIEILRLYSTDEAVTHVGWLFALADKQLSVAMEAMHENPGENWTLKELATIAGMSRSAFAQRFKEKVGTSAIDYLIRWRMFVAADQLVNTDESIATVATSLGYESESAFSFAFKRVMGSSPRQYCRGQKRVAGEQ